MSNAFNAELFGENAYLSQSDISNRISANGWSCFFSVLIFSVLDALDPPQSQILAMFYST